MQGLSRTWIDGFLIALYIGAIVCANWVVTLYGQAALPFTAFVLIPFDLVVRDLLQDRWQTKRRVDLWMRMGVLVLVGGFVSYVSTVAAPRIALASCLAFTLTGLIDCLTYQSMIRYGRIFRINGATVLAAFTDSMVFALLAFGPEASTGLIILQGLSKCTGGLVWSLILFRLFQKPTPPVALRPLPPGLRGVAKLTFAGFREYQKGPYKGECYFHAVGIIVEPSAGKDAWVLGCKIELQIPIIAHPCHVNGERGLWTIKDRMARILNELRKLGWSGLLDQYSTETAVQSLERAVKEVNEKAPYFWFVTYQTKDGRIWEDWQGIRGLEDYKLTQLCMVEDTTDDLFPPSPQEKA